MSLELVDDLIGPDRRNELISFPNSGETLARDLASLPLPDLTDSFEAVLAKVDVEPRNNIEIDPITLPDVSLEKIQARLARSRADSVAVSVPAAYTDNRGLLAASEASSVSEYSDETVETELTEDEVDLSSMIARSVAYLSAADIPSTSLKDLSSILILNRAAVIGGAIVRDINLIVCQGPTTDLKFVDIPVLPLQVPPSEQAFLFSRVPEHGGESSESTLILPEKYVAPPGFEDDELFAKDGDFGTKAHTERVKSVKEEMTDRGMEKAKLQLYTVSGDIVDFWGIKGLSAKLYKYKGLPKEESKDKEPAREKVVLNAKSLVFEGQPLGKLFEFIELDEISHLPIENLELTYSEEDKSKNPLHKPGLCLEVDVVLKDSLQWVGDSIKSLFNTAHPPTIHLSAHLSDERNWSKPPEIEKLVLQGYFKGMSIKPWNILEFKTMGMEMTAVKRNDYWYFGFGFIGEVDLIGIPEAQVPRGLTYRLARDPVLSHSKGSETGHKWDLLLVAENWKQIFGYDNVTMTKVFLEASFYEGHFNSSISLDVGGEIKIGDATVQVGGYFSKSWVDNVTWTWLNSEKGAPPLAREEYFIKARIGDLKLSDIRKIHAQITGRGHAGDAGDTTDDDITFKNMYFKIACIKYSDTKLDTKSLELAGEVTVGDASTYSARLTFATEGISVTGAVSNVHIPGTDVVIEKAGLQAFLALKSTAPDTESKASAAKEGKKKDEVKKHRQSSFQILGVINFHNAIFRAGFYTAKGEKDSNRDWLVFGTAEHIRIRDAWPEIPHDSFLNLQLENVAVIASSKERKGNIKDIEMKAKDKEDKKDGNNIHGEWDVLKEIEALDYPVDEGFQICANIVSFQQLEQINNMKKIEGLMLYLGYSSKGEFKASIRIPPSFRIDISKHAYLHTVTTSIVIDHNGPYLQLQATLTINMEKSDPIHVTGVIVGTLRGLNGELFMESGSRWINPFDLHKELVVSNLGIGVGFDYATVLVVGPTRLSFKGQVNIAEYQGSMDVGVDVTKAAAVLRIELNKLDVTDIIKIAGVLANEKALEHAADGARGLVVFSDLKLYLSSGARFMGEYYERGVEVRGSLDFWGKKADFQGKFTEDGLSIKGGLDAFKFGGLEVTSLKEYKGKKRATLDIEVSRTTQKVVIDGIIRFYDIELQVYINADLQTCSFEADIIIKLAEILTFTLKAKVEAYKSQQLENTVANFEAHLELNVLDTIIDGILEALEVLTKWATDEIDKTKAGVEKRLGELRSELAKLEKRLIELRAESQREVLKKREKIDEENKFLRERNEEIKKYEEKVKEARASKVAKDTEIHELERKRDAAKARLDQKRWEMQKEYERRVQEEKNNQEYWRQERLRLETKKNASFGDTLRKRETADASWHRWTKIEEERWSWISSCQWNLDNCYWWDKPYWLGKLTEATLGLEQAHASKAAEAELLHAAEAITNSPAFRAIEDGINTAIDEVVKFEQALEKLVEKGPMGYIEEMSRDEKRDLQRRIDLLKELERDSKDLQKKLEEAIKYLDEKKGTLSPAQEEARKKIVDLEAAIKLKPWETELRNKRADFDSINTQVKGLLQTLDDIKKGIKVGDDLIRQAAKFMKEALPQIKSVTVKASSQTIAKDSPFMFEVTASWIGEMHTVHIEWAPNQDAHELYSSAAKKLISLVDG